MTTDYRSLCVELIDALDSGIPAARICLSPLANRARAALAERLVRPTDEELWATGGDDFRACYCATDAIRYARAILARWGNHQVSLTSSTQPLPEGNHPAKPNSSPADGEVAELVAWLRGTRAARLTRAADLLQRLSPPQPVPVSERPWERQGWCDKDGRCWFGWADEPDASWSFCKPSERDTATVSIPANALPTPEVTND